MGLGSDKTEVVDGLDIELVELDVTEEAEIRNFFSGLDRLDILFNGAGIVGKDERDLATFEKVVKVHLTASFFFSELARPLLKESEVASIVNVSSMGGIFGISSIPAYTSSKGAIDQLTKTNAVDFAKDNIRVNAVAPGFINTIMTNSIEDEYKKGIETRIPQGRFGESEEIADVVAFLCAPAASHVTGTVLPIDGGYSISG